MLSIEVNSYRVFLNAAMDFTGSVHAVDPSIFLYDATGRFFARINFRPNEDLSGVQAVNLDTLPWFHLSYLRGDYQFVLDILRNEKPVYLHFSENLGTPTAVLTTSPEPIGEGEVPI